MAEKLSFLGSAAGSAGALGEAGGHDSGKERRRAASARRVPSTPPKAGKDRSRSPGDDVPITKTEVADRSIVAPLYIAPGGEGDPMGADGRRAHNMEKTYGFMNVVAQVLDQHRFVPLRPASHAEEWQHARPWCERGDEHAS